MCSSEINTTLSQHSFYFCLFVSSLPRIRLSVNFRTANPHRSFISFPHCVSYVSYMAVFQKMLSYCPKKSVYIYPLLELATERGEQVCVWWGLFIHLAFLALSIPSSKPPTTGNITLSNSLGTAFNIVRLWICCRERRLLGICS